MVLSLPSDCERGLAILPALSRIAPGKVIVVGPTSNGGTILRVLRAGAVDFVDAADLEVDLKCTIEHIAKANVIPSEPGRLIAVLGPNGELRIEHSCGKFGRCTRQEIQGRRASRHETRVGRLGRVARRRSYFFTSPTSVTIQLNWIEVCWNDRSSNTIPMSIFLLHHSELADVVHVQAEGVGLAVSLARASFPYVVVDVDHSFRKEQRVVLQKADVILIVLRLDFTSLRNVRRTIEYLSSLNIPAENIRIVIKPLRSSPQEVPAGKAQEALGLKISTILPKTRRS